MNTIEDMFGLHDAVPVESGTDHLRGYKDGAVGWMIFNNPSRHNAVSLAMWAGISRVLAAFGADESVRAVIVTGAGGKAFVSGADLSEFGALRDTAEANEAYTAVSRTARRDQTQFKKPLIAMIDGYCIGGGLVVALGCDVRIASENSVFGIPAAKLGLGYALGGVVQLVDIVGPAVASDMLLSARNLSAEEALRVGLVSRLAPRDTLRSLVGDYAVTIAANAPMTVRTAKQSIAEAVKARADRDVSKIEVAVKACFDSEDYREGRAAFAEKRPPRFKGK